MPRQTSQAKAAKDPSTPAAKSESVSEGSGLLRMTVYFHQAEWSALRQESDKQNTTMANLVRRAVRDYLKLK